MALAPRLDLRQSQSLVMTPQLQQAIKLLALSNIEIETYIAGELEKNPLLELARGGAGQDGDGSREPDALPEVAHFTGEAASDAMMRDDAVATDNPLDNDSTLQDRGDGDDAAPASMRGEGAGSLSDATRMSQGYAEDGPDFENFAGREFGLPQHLIDSARRRHWGSAEP